MGAERRTFCRICEAACGLVLNADATQLRPDKQHPISQGYVCAKGMRFLEANRHPTRLTTPKLRDSNGALRDTSWEEAMGVAGERLKAVIAEHGPDAVGVYWGNPLGFHALGMTAMYGFTGALGSRNVYSAGSQDCANKFAGAEIVHGSPLVHPIPDLDHTRLALMFGTNPAVSQSSFLHAVGATRAYDRLIARGGKTLWFDPRETESAKRWGGHVPVRPGSDVWVLLALLGLLAGERSFRGRDQRGLEELVGLAREVTPERAAALSGLSAERVREIAAQVRAAGNVVVHIGVGINQGRFGTLCCVLTQALAYVTGNFDRVGGILFHPLGARLGRFLLRSGLGRRAGIQRGAKPRSRVGGFPSVFGALPGGVLADEILQDGPGRIRALVVIAGDPLRSIPGSRRFEQALQRLETVVSVDMFENATGKHADVLLPSTSMLERADASLVGAFLQHGDRLQTTRAALPAEGDVRNETQILTELSAKIGRPAFGTGWLTRGIAKLDWDRWFERGLSLLGAFGRADAHSVVWARPKPGSYLGRGSAHPHGRVHFWSPELAAERERLRVDERRVLAQQADGGFLLLGRRRRLGHNSWLHGGLRDGTPDASAWLCPDDAQALGLSRGDQVVLGTPSGEVTLPVTPKAGVASGTVIVPHGLPSLNVNELIPAGAEQVEPISGMLFMTAVPVSVTPAAAQVHA